MKVFSKFVMHGMCVMMLLCHCIAQSKNDLANLLSGLSSSPVQQSIQQPYVAPQAATPKKTNSNNSALLENFLQQSTDSTPQEVSTVVPQHSKGQISLFLQSLQNEPERAPSPKKAASNVALLQNFLQETQGPLYQAAMSILGDKTLQNEYRQNMEHIDLLFLNYSITQLQSFHVHTKSQPRNLSSMLDELSASVSQVTNPVQLTAKNNLQALLSQQDLSPQGSSTDVEIMPKKSTNNAQLLASLQSQG